MDLQDVSVDELVKGYQSVNGHFHCLFCGELFDQEEVFQRGQRFFTAEGMVKRHIGEQHGSPFHAIIGLDKKLTGLSSVQAEMLQHFFEEMTDAEIVEKSSVNSVSTVRQHRFKLREKERQAKLFLALMEGLKEKDKYTVHKGARQVDERYSIEGAEREKVLKTYFKDGLDGSISSIPSKEKKKLIILQQIIKRFEQGKTYSEAEVNAVLQGVHADYVSLRRHLIEYGFMERNDDGSSYWMKG